MTHYISTPVARRFPKGFSLIEMLVVIGIIAVLAGILLPVAYRASRQASLTKLAADLQIISSALEAYRSDFGDYPRLRAIPDRITPPNKSPDRGSVILAWSLIGPYPLSFTPTLPGDGANGTGFRIRPGQGKVYGPYIPADRFRTAGAIDYDLSPNIPIASGELALIDGFGSPILYYPGKSGTRVGPTSPNYLAASPNHPDAHKASFNPYDNPELTPAALLDRLTKANFTGPFVLWSAGPDQIFGNKDDVSNVVP